MDTQKPLASRYTEFYRSLMQFSSERSIGRARRDAGDAAQRTLELPYIITRTFTTLVYTPQVLTPQVSYFFIVYLKRGRVIKPLDINLERAAPVR